jgi:adenosylcobyric acid synthase
MRSLSIFGTSSDAGKSTIALAVCKILQEEGFSVAPFKAQNMSNNACVCDDGGEIGVAQYTQALMLGLPTSYHFNPILLKPQKDSESQVVIRGKAVITQDARAYFRDLDTLKPIIKEAFDHLSSRYDTVICEGAGSPVELNLMNKDLSNIFVATEFDTKIILVADIERGGVFASIYGTYDLLPKNIRQNVIGVIINKFRGDISLFDEGRTIIEEKFGIPVLGIVPYIPQHTAYEDALSLINYAPNPNGTVKIAVIWLPHISNFTDIEPFIADPAVSVKFIKANTDLSGFDIVILPGSKATIGDLAWMKKNGLFESIKTSKAFIVGLCGGYQMAFDSLFDPYGIENEAGSRDEGFGYVDDEIIFKEQKQLAKGRYEIFCETLFGYEIHCGVSAKYPLGFESENFLGTHLHGIFENDSFRTKFLRRFCKEYAGYKYDTHKQNELQTLVNTVRESIDVQKIIEALSC